MGLSALDQVAVAAAAVAGGAVNALAGGGTLITFPTLTGVGVPSLRANVTNTVALTPGYLGGTVAQRRDLEGQRRRLWLVIPAGIVGGLTGGILLVITSEELFRELVPYLILLATLLLAVQERVRAYLLRRTTEGARGDPHEAWVVVPTFAASVYGGYFGAGLGVIVLAVLGLVIEDTLTRINALKQALSFVVNVTAAVFFLFSGKVVWSVALTMAVGALIGGMIGGRLAGRIPPRTLRGVVVAVGLVVTVVYFVS
ncbi:MAG: sulfite exporter TauE/SafE family protein [Candidatus Velamenicoccus archaeovorus]